MAGNAARVRIGRVRMKGGGAEVRVLARQEATLVASHMREWVAGCLGDYTRPPDAYAAVAFWIFPLAPGRPFTVVGLCTETDALSIPLLVQSAATALIHDAAAESGKARALEVYGDAPPSWTPDAA